jgi:hypothetical protein
LILYQLYSGKNIGKQRDGISGEETMGGIL